MFNHPILQGMSKADREVFAGELRKSMAGEYGRYIGEKLVKLDTSQGVTTGLNQLPIPLEAPAKLLYPVTTPIRNSVPRSVVGGNDITWRYINAINSAKLWGAVAEASASTTGRNDPITYTGDKVNVSFKSVEMEDLLTPEAQFGSRSSLVPQEDFGAKEFSVLSLLQSTMIAEERIDLFGNITALGTPATPTAQATQPASGTGSLTPGATYSVKVTALTGQGLIAGSTGHASSDAIGETDPSNVLTATLPGSGAGSDAWAVQWTAKAGAVAYNVYAYTSTSVRYIETVYSNKYTLKALGSSTNVPNTLDKTANALDYDGLIALSYKTGTYVKNNNNAVLAADGTGGVDVLDALFLAQYANKVSPNKLLVSAKTKKAIDSVIVGVTTSPILRIDATAGDLNITGTLAVKSVMNRYMNVEVPIEVHPFMPDGMILAPCLGGLGPYYTNARIAANVEKMLAWDYRQVDYTAAKRAWEMGIDFRGALINHAPFAMGVIDTIGYA